ncbi:hypothetical protein BC830DRAFT_386442 [Chytriomyces sp. MP71]|nr:hypothetical protein BC830DRAFT_386442 [Chytriomyces sp. MP71]
MEGTVGSFSSLRLSALIVVGVCMLVVSVEFVRTVAAIVASSSRSHARVVAEAIQTPAVTATVTVATATAMVASPVGRVRSDPGRLRDTNNKLDIEAESVSTLSPIRTHTHSQSHTNGTHHQSCPSAHAYLPPLDPPLPSSSPPLNFTAASVTPPSLTYLPPAFVSRANTVTASMDSSKRQSTLVNGSLGLTAATDVKSLISSYFSPSLRKENQSVTSDFLNHKHVSLVIENDDACSQSTVDGGNPSHTRRMDSPMELESRHVLQVPQKPSFADYFSFLRRKTSVNMSVISELPGDDSKISLDFSTAFIHETELPPVSAMSTHHVLNSTLVPLVTAPPPAAAPIQAQVALKSIRHIKLMIPEVDEDTDSSCGQGIGRRKTDRLSDDSLGKYLE